MDEMTCQLCLAKEATRFVSEQSPGGRLVRAYYCSECYVAKYRDPPPPSQGFPRPRYTLKTFMILVAVFSVPNAIAAWVMSYVTGTPAQLRQWSIYAFLGVNVVLGFGVAWFSVVVWLGRLIWFNRTGGLVPMPAQQVRRQLASLRPTLLFVAWCMVATSLMTWLTLMTRPVPRSRSRLFPSLFILFYLILVFGPPLAIVVLRLSRDPGLRNRIRQNLRWKLNYIRQDWRMASRPELFLRSLALAWTVGIFFVFGFGGPRLLSWGFMPWFPIPPVVLVGIVGQLLLTIAWALSIRRR